MGNVIATTGRLLLREIEPTDQDLVLDLALGSSNPLFTSLNEKHLAIYRSAIWDEVNVPSTFNAMIFLKKTGEFVGKVCMQCIDKPLPEVGIDLLEEYRNKGFGPEAVKAFCNWYGAKHNLDKVKARISKENSHSIHTFEKLGAFYTESVPFFEKSILDKIAQKLPNESIESLLQEDVREYLLNLPI